MDAFSETVRNDDGTFTATLGGRSARWPSADGSQWLPYENRVRLATAQEAARGEAFVVAGNGYEASFAAATEALTGDALVRLAQGDVSIGVVAVGAKPSLLSRADASVIYAGAFPDADLRYRVDGDRIKEEIVLTKAPAEAPTYAFDLQLEGLTAQLAEHGGIDFLDADKDVRFHMPRPFMVDGHPDMELDERRSEAIALSLTESAPDTVRLELRPDLAWLADPERIYPVAIDPTLVSIEYEDGLGDTAQINEGSPTTNYLGNETLHIGKNGSGGARNGLIRFPEFSALPSDSVIVSATLSLWGTGGSTGLPLGVDRITSTWDEASVTWNTRPSWTNVDRVTFSSEVGSWNNMDITGHVRQWLATGADNHGVRLLSTGASGLATGFASNYYADASKRPKLDITYAQAYRHGLSSAWTYASQQYGGGNVSYVNLSTGNVVVQHDGGSIPTRGFEVDLVSTYNSQDAEGQAGYINEFFGEGWSFSADLRLQSLSANGAAVAFLDGRSGMKQIYVKEADAGGQRTYTRPVHYGYTLTKDIGSPPADAAKVYTLTADQGGERSFFDANGRLTRRQDDNGNYLTYTYDASNRLTRIRDVAGRDTILEYLGPGSPQRLSKITDMAGRVSTYGYDSSGNLTTIKHAVGTTSEVTTVFGYGPDRLLTSVRNPRGHTSYVRYQPPKFDWETSGSADGWTNGSQVGSPTFTGSGSLRVDATVSNYGQLTSTTAAKTYATPVTWNATDQDLVAMVQLSSLQTFYPIYASLELWDEHTDPAGPSSWSSGRLLTPGQWVAVRIPSAQVSPAAKVKKIGLRVSLGDVEPTPYNATATVYVDYVSVRGIGASLTDAKPTPNTIASFDYDWDAREAGLSRPDQNGTQRRTEYRSSRAGQVVEVTDPVGNVTMSAQDEFLNLVSQTLPGGAASSYTYSYYQNSNHLRTITNELGERSRRVADPGDGDTLHMIDPLNEQRRSSGSQSFLATSLDRDLMTDNVTSVSNAWYDAGTDLEDPAATPASTERRLEFTYGTGGTIASMKDPRGNLTYLSYQTGTGYLTEIDAPAGTGETTRRVTTITPNTDGTVQEAVDPRDKTTEFDYDGLGRLRRIDYGVVSGTPAFSHTYTLDSNGNMTAMTDRTGSSSWVYDENNQLISESRTQAGVTKTAAYAYYANGLQKQITTFAGQTSTLGYDSALRLSSQTDPKDGGRAISYGYDARSRRNEITYPSGVSQTTTFDTAGRVDLLTLEKADGTDLQRFDHYYGFNAQGQRQADYERGNVIRIDELDGSVVTYDYDALDRLSDAVRTGTNPFTQSYGYDKNDNRTSITSGGTTTNATYDAANQMTALGSVAYSYDPNGNMTAFGGNTLTYDAADKWAGGTVNGSSLSLRYDGHGRRISREVAGARTDFWHDATGLTLETGAASATYLREPGGLLLSVSSGGSLSNYGRDRLGTITALTSGSQTLTNTYRYDPWGQAIGGSGSAYNPFQYTATYKDAATGLYQMGARYYQPASGRFTQLDPHPGQLLTVNRFAYTGCNPTNYTDPTGLSHCSDGELLRTAAVAASALFLLGLAAGAAPPAVAAVIALHVFYHITLFILIIEQLNPFLDCWFHFTI